MPSVELFRFTPLLPLLAAMSFYLSLSECFGDEPTLTVRAGAVFLQRSDPDNALLAFELGGPPPSLVNAQDLDFGVEPGYELGVIRHGAFDTPIDLEFRYFNIDDLNATTANVPTTFPVFNFATPFFVAAPGTSVSAL